MYTLLKTGFDMKPMIKKVVVVCPTSLVKNWDDEITKWLKGRVQTVALAGCRSIISVLMLLRYLIDH